MKKTDKDLGIILAIIINLVLNLEWSIPAWIALILYFTIHIPIYIFWALLLIWILWIVLTTIFLGYITKLGNERDMEKENKNPYSNKNI